DSDLHPSSSVGTLNNQSGSQKPHSDLVPHHVQSNQYPCSSIHSDSVDKCRSPPITGS
ncbi:hypothetical protein KI387_025495, partial [Taxus chinensis]